MPLYAIKCKDCSAEEQIFRKIAERDSLPPCYVCGGDVERLIQAPAVVPDIPHYVSPATGRLITSRAERREDLKASGSIAWEPGIEKDIARNRVHQQEKAFEPISRAVDEIVAGMNAAGKLETTNA